MTLRTNLATRPFYNVRAVQVAVGVLALIVLALTLYNVAQFINLRATHQQKTAHAVESEAEVQRLRAEAARIRSQIDQKELEAVAAAAREANSIIDRRAFSWTDLLTQLEATLPDDVRITSVQPRVEEGVLKIGIVSEARRVEDLSDFVEALEEKGAFKNVVPVLQQATEDGLIRLAIDSEYQVPVREPAATPAPTSGGGAGDSRE
jgi:Tfp pilus assembly protein PilN